jgi:hypothetical protein
MQRIRLVRINSQISDRAGNLGRRNQSIVGKRMQRCNRDTLGVHLEEPPQSFPRIAPAETIRAEHNIALADPGSDQVGNCLYKIGRRSQI